MIPEVAPYNNYTGDSSTTKFDFDFYIEDSTQLVVQLTQEDGTIKTLTNDTDYTIHEVGNKNGSYITFPITGSSYSTLSSSEIISLSLSLPIAQESEYGTSSELDLVGLEYSFDYLTRICQIMNRQVVRALKVAEGSNISTDELAFDVEKIAGIADDVSTVAGISADVTAVKNNAANITTVAEDLVNIDAASDNAILAKQYAVGIPQEPIEGSAKYWAQQASFGQIQADWNESDTTSKAYIQNKPAGLSSFTDNLGSNPIHTHSQYELISRPVNTLITLGTISLQDNSINSVTPSGNITFTLPAVTDNTTFHQILVQINLSTLYTIDLGTTYYFNKIAPDMSAIGIYDLIYEYDKANGYWVVGCLNKGA